MIFRLAVAGVLITAATLRIVDPDARVDAITLICVLIAAAFVAVPSVRLNELVGRLSTVSAFGVSITLEQAKAIQATAGQVARQEALDDAGSGDDAPSGSSTDAVRRIELAATDCNLGDQATETPPTLLERLVDRRYVDAEVAEVLRVLLSGAVVPSELSGAFDRAASTALRVLRPVAFERAVADVLRSAGFVVSRGIRGDHRVDLVAQGHGLVWLVETKLALRQDGIIEAAIQRFASVEAPPTDRRVIVVPDRSRVLFGDRAMPEGIDIWRLGDIRTEFGPHT